MSKQVSAWEEKVIIPTYKTGKPDPNPMFFEKRVYQGSSGKVYPHAVIDQVYDEKYDKEYQAVFIENEYLKIMILPELGGRIQMAYDKTNDYHFVYHNRVIKPALVGLAGPWISGGIEFNWPQHHRPSTFDPIDFSIEEHADGSATVWVSEVEKMFHTKGMAGFRLYPGKAYLEITGKLHNRTALPQTFLWWANPAVAVDNDYQSVFPPDVTAVYDHGKRDVSSFPIAKGTYYKTDYAPGTDISWYKNIPVPTSFMAVASNFDFVGGYHHRRKAGILHVANHHVSPGKKQWTWGHGAFGRAWDKQLTDEDGPYVEIMTGMYTDNQPDFSWIMPGQEISFQQYFLPYKEIGYVKNATKEALVNLELEGQRASLCVYVTEHNKLVTISLHHKGQEVYTEQVVLSPLAAFRHQLSLQQEVLPQHLTVSVTDGGGRVLVSYTPVVADKQTPVPSPATPMLAPEVLKSTEALYMAGLHLEQYRHATYNPVAYYQEALRRDRTDIRNNNALGLWYLRRGRFAKAETYFQQAVDSLLQYNPNPYDAEPVYNLGLSLYYQRKMKEACNWFYKSAWDAQCQENAYLKLAQLEAVQGNWQETLDLADRSLARNVYNYQARHLKVIALRHTGRLGEAIRYAGETLCHDAFAFNTLYELVLCAEGIGDAGQATTYRQQLVRGMRNNPVSYIDLAMDYANCGAYGDAIRFMLLCEGGTKDPLFNYYLGYWSCGSGDDEAATQYLEQGYQKDPAYVFPNRLEDIAVLQFVTDRQPRDHKAPYYLGNLWYDKQQYQEAIGCWERSVKIYDAFPTVYRNLSIAWYNKGGETFGPLAAMEKAFALNEQDARILFELDQLYKKQNYPVKKRKALLDRHTALLPQRDDLLLEYITLLNITGDHAAADAWLKKRTFHPWEGGEGKVTGQYLFTRTALAKTALNAGQAAEALQYLEEASTYPDNLGEGKLPNTPEQELHYLKGVCYDLLGDALQARGCWEAAAKGHLAPTDAIYYNDTPPDAIFYQGLALYRLQRAGEARKKFRDLLQYAQEHIDDTVSIHYFAVSLPDFMIFEDDADKRNKVHCHYLLYLGYAGLGKAEEAMSHYNAAMDLDGSHTGLHKNAPLINRSLINLAKAIKQGTESTKQ
ncbi:DUF5107 domain-containing protein [Paraflavitalea pollutisoli]|uniref:DUF5107 domain-containing protein n=1 Tax=Paraflavitalea pollutisoli TaxID=3034143 RepID=UPI0023ECAF1C|nr:DUF5107 domain-containing protein [Paraflavitalea sp. H1-2-19X]